MEVSDVRETRTGGGVNVICVGPNSEIDRRRTFCPAAAAAAAGGGSEARM